MKDSLFWRGIAFAFVAGILYVGHGLNSHTTIPLPALTPSAHGSVGVATENAETVFTSSADGKHIYMWQYYSSRAPKFLGHGEAVLEQ